jgi:transcriptional regulator with XRE-family HTH domain
MRMDIPPHDAESAAGSAGKPFTVADLRAELGLSLAEFAARIGITSKGHASLIERSGTCSLRAALAIEELSGGRIDAAQLSPDVAAARAVLANERDAA